MQPPPTVFSQIHSVLFPSEFARCVAAFPTRRPVRGLSEYDHFLALCFGQLTYRESLRDIVACLKSRRRSLYHSGFRGKLSRTNLAYANHHRDWRLFEAVAQILMRRAARLYQDDIHDPDLPKSTLVLDSSIVSLSLSLFPWGYYARSRQAALKLHLMLSLQGNVPAWAAITEATLPDMKILDRVVINPGAYYVMDRGYLDFERLFRFEQAGAYFVVRNKSHVRSRVVRSFPVDKATGLRCDQTIRLTSSWSVRSYPRLLRRVSVCDAETGDRLVLLTNQFELPALHIAELYRKRWQVELFFKWIKQHLSIRRFYGRSENAVRCQVWSAISAYLMVAIVRKNLEVRKNLNEMLQVISVSVFEEIPIKTLFSDEVNAIDAEKTPDQSQNLFVF